MRIHSISLVASTLVGITLLSAFCQEVVPPPRTSGNPIIKHVRTADPSVLVGKDGTVWLYTSHDQNDAVDYNTMDGYRVFSSSNLVDWKDHGEILHSKDLSWGDRSGFMFAPDAVFSKETYYLYFPHLTQKMGFKIGVATSQSPQGPFKEQGFVKGPKMKGGFDPRCFIDDDGQAYLYWGSVFDTKAPMVAKLKENMMELAEEPRIIDYGEGDYFSKNLKRPGEGIYMHKRKGVYYFSFSAFDGYAAMGDNPYGPFTRLHKIAEGGKGAQDHHSIIEIAGEWYYFYHLGNFHDGKADGSLYRRNVCVDKLYYNPDGTIKVVTKSDQGVEMIEGKTNPGAETVMPVSKDIESEIEEILAVNRDGIETNRTTMITLRTAPGATVKVNQTRHAFEFGTAISYHAFVPNDRIGEADQEKYKEILKANFNSVVHENEMKWYSNEKERGKLTFADADAMLDWSEANGLYTRGHCVYWDKDAHVQQWQKELDNDSLRNAIKQRAADYMGHFKDRVHEHDVNNEMLHYNYYGKRLGTNIRKEMFDWCGELDPKATLYVNEFDIIAGKYTDKYVAQIEGFLKDGMKVGGIGVQGHFGGNISGPEVKKKLDLLAKFGLPIKVTEFDASAGDERAKAIALVTLYATAFAHPAIEGIYMWGFWEKTHWIPNAALWKTDWRETMAAKYFRELLFKRWWTRFEGKADDNGACEVRIFFGEHEVTVNGQVRRFTIEKKCVNKMIDCRAPEPTKWEMIK